METHQTLVLLLKFLDYRLLLIVALLRVWEYQRLCVTPLSGAPRIHKVLSVSEYVRLLALRSSALLVVSSNFPDEFLVFNLHLRARASHFALGRCRNLSQRKVLDAGLKLLFVALQLFFGNCLCTQCLMVLRLIVVHRPGISEPH